jgi:hypothetical protein
MHSRNDERTTNEPEYPAATFSSLCLPQIGLEADFLLFTVFILRLIPLRMQR